MATRFTSSSTRTKRKRGLNSTFARPTFHPVFSRAICTARKVISIALPVGSTKGRKHNERQGSQLHQRLRGRWDEDTRRNRRILRSRASHRARLVQRGLRAAL